MQATAFIVDDVPKFCELVRVLLEKRHPNVKVLGTAGNVTEAAALILERRPEILFLDVDLGDMNGFDLLRRIEPFKPLVIFTTGDPKHALQAIEFKATHYLVKPFDGPKFDEAVLRALKELEELKGPRPPNAPHGMVVSDEQIALPDSKGLTMLHIDELLYCESDNNYTHVFRRGEPKPFTVSKGIVAFDDALREKGFVRIHQSYLVNKKHIKRYVKGEGGEVIMSNGANLPVSRRQKPELLAALERI